MDTSHELEAPLTELLYEMAQEDADEEATNVQGTVWAGLLRDGEDVVARLTEQFETDGSVARDEIDDEDWTALRDAFGIIVRRDTRRSHSTARAFANELDLLDEWEATRLISCPPPRSRRLRWATAPKGRRQDPSLRAATRRPSQRPRGADRDWERDDGGGEASRVPPLIGVIGIESRCMRSRAMR